MTTYAERIAAQSIVVLNPDTENARRVFPTGTVETYDGVDFVVFENEPGEFARTRIREMRPATAFGFVI